MIEFPGIPERFLQKATEDKCFRCSESTCALVRLVKTRARRNREEMEDEEESREVLEGDSDPTVESLKRPKLH